MQTHKVILPEYIIFRIIKNALDQIRIDFAANSATETNSLLYRICEQNVLQRYDLFTQAKSIFIDPLNANEPKFLDISIGFDTDRIAKKNPTIHLILQSESPKDDTLGLGYGNVPADFINETEEDPGSVIREFYTTGYTSSVNLLISGDNSNEKILIYHIIRALLTTYIPYFENQGLRNIKFTGGDVQINTGVAGNMYMRNLSMKYDYFTHTPEVENREIITNVFYELILVIENGENNNQ